MKAVLLLSGGIDSPVAGYLLGRQGVELVALHMDNRPFSSRDQIEKAKQLASRLGQLLGQRIPLYGMPHRGNQTTIAQTLERHYQCVFCRRMMWRCAERLAEQEGAQFLITGESLGQVASQTLSNLHSETQAVRLPMVRPLIGYDKVEIERIAKRIGTYEISTLPGLCCTIVPEKPATVSHLDRILAEEQKVDTRALLDAAWASLEVWN